jgi:uncharacterized coiled-coil protein SlyX
MTAKNRSILFVATGILAVLLLAVIVGSVVVNKFNKQVNLLSEENNALEEVINERDSLVNEFIAAFDTIESSLTFINERRSQLVLDNNETTPTQREAIIQDIKMMNEMLVESSLEIEELEKKLKKSGVQMQSLRNKIASLNKRIEQQNTYIAELQGQVEEQKVMLAQASDQNMKLQGEVSSMKDTVVVKEQIIDEKEEIIALQTEELNKGYIAYGTIKELKEAGVVQKEGGFLGLGKSKMLQSNINEDYFTRLDITEDRTFALNAKKVKIISDHPADSYRLIEENGLITKLEIDAPEDFWKISNYAVIEVKL